MLRKKRRGMCSVFICILLMTGMYTVYMKADSAAEHAAVTETVRLQSADDALLSETGCIVERDDTVFRIAAVQVRTRTIFVRKDMRLPILCFYGLCMLCFHLSYGYIEERLWLHEKKYRAALIKYMHDTDGKKKVACLM